MKIQNQSITKSSKNIEFKSLLRGGGLKPIDSAFNRDLKALKAVTKTVQEFFPKKATVITGACSNGEESWSLYMNFDNPELYEFLGVDICKDPVRLAKKGIYTVFSDYSDSYLIKPEGTLTHKEKELQQLFKKYFLPTEKPDYEINTAPKFLQRKAKTSGFKEEFFKVKDEFKDKIKFVQGDISNIDELAANNSPVAAILFRNAFYHVFNNHLTEHIMGITNSNSIRINRQAISNSLIDKFHKELEPNGAFALGEHSKEHFVLADEFTSPDNIIQFRELPSYESYRKGYEKFAATNFGKIITNLPQIKTLEEAGRVKICRKSPIQIALEQNRRFEPIEQSSVNFFDTKYNLPTVWQKVN